VTRSTALGIAAIGISVLFAVVAIVPSQPRPWTVGAAIILGSAALLWLFLISLPKMFDWFQRHNLRKRHGLNQKALDGPELPPSKLHPCSWFGYEVIYATYGLKELDPDKNKWARIKQTNGSSQPVATQFPLEVHGYHGETFLVGYLSDDDKNVVDGTEAGEIILWMRPVWTRNRRATRIVEIPLSRITNEGSRGLGTRKSPYQLLLTLSESSHQIQR
jgi:hypothetical protein